MRKLMIIIMALVLASSFVSAAEVIRGKSVPLSSWAKRDYSAACYRDVGKGYICPGMANTGVFARSKHVTRIEGRSLIGSKISKGQNSVTTGPMMISGKPERSFGYRAEDRTYLDQYKKY